MGQPPRQSLRVLFCLLGLHTSTAIAEPLSRQSLPDLEDRFTFNPQGQYQPRFTGLLNTSRKNSTGAAEILAPIFQNSQGILFTDVRIGNASQAVYQISAGGGLRYFLHPNLIGSTYIFMNHQEDYQHGPESAVTTGIELLTHGYEGRFNAQFQQPEPACSPQSTAAQLYAKVSPLPVCQERSATISPAPKT